MSKSSSDVTRLLRDVRAGRAGAVDELTSLVYRELHRLAHLHMRKESSGHTLQTTALLHEAFVKLVDADVDWQDRVHFYSTASRLMRRILVDNARAKRARKRGGASDPLPLDETIIGDGDVRWDIVDLHLALERLAAIEPRQVEALELRFFAGMSNEQVARALGMAVSTARAEMRRARAWLRWQLSSDTSDEASD